MNTHPQAVHDDAQGPLLFLGGQTSGQFRTVNRSRDEWVIPVSERYLKRRFHLGGRTGPVVTVMVLDSLSDVEAQEMLLVRIADWLAEGKW